MSMTDDGLIPSCHHQLHLSRCVGVTKPAGTGALIFDSKITNQRIITPDTLSSFVLQQGEVIQELRFTRNKAHWDTATGVCKGHTCITVTQLDCQQSASRLVEMPAGMQVMGCSAATHWPDG